MKKIIKIFLIIVVLISIVTLNKNVYAEKLDVTKELDSWDPSWSQEESPEFNQKIGVILGIINTIGVIVSVVTLMIIGIKYMFGSVQEKADYKGVLLPWLIGAIILFSGTTLPNLIYTMSKGALENSRPGQQVLYCPDCHTEVYLSNGRYYCRTCGKYVYNPITK